MNEYLKGIAPPLVCALIGGLAYFVFIWLKYGLAQVKEKELVLAMFELGSIFSAFKIILLAFDEEIPIDTAIDRTYLVIAGVLAIVITLKDFVAKFR